MSEEPLGRRRVIKVEADRRGEVLEVPREPHAYQGQQIESIRRWLVGVMVVLAAILIGLMTALVSAVKTDVPAIVDRAGQSAPMVWERSIYSIGAGAESLLLAPTSVAVSPAGAIYVTEPQRGRVDVFNSAGAFVTALAPIDEDGTPVFGRPESVEVDEVGNVFVADPVAGEVHAFNAGLELVRSIPVPDEPTGSAAWGRELYVLGRGRVNVVDVASGTVVRWFGSLGDSEGEINAYHGIAVDGDGVYIADALNRRVIAFNHQGDWLWEATGRRSDDRDSGTAWQLPQDLTIDASGRIVVVDALGFDLSAMLPGSDLVVARWGENGAADGSFSYPSSVAYDAEYDRFVVADTKNNRVQIVSLPGSAPVATSIVKTVVVGPWRYLTIPLGIALTLIALASSFLVLRVRKR